MARGYSTNSKEKKKKKDEAIIEAEPIVQMGLENEHPTSRADGGSVDLDCLDNARILRWMGQDFLQVCGWLRLGLLIQASSHTSNNWVKHVCKPWGIFLTRKWDVDHAEAFIIFSISSTTKLKLFGNLKFKSILNDKGSIGLTMFPIWKWRHPFHSYLPGKHCPPSSQSLFTLLSCSVLVPRTQSLFTVPLGQDVCSCC